MIHKILIEPCFRTVNKISDLIRYNIITQAKLFELGFKITNTNGWPTGSFILKNIRIRSSEGKDMLHTIDNSFQVNTLNPEATTEIWVDKFGTYLNGLAQVSFEITSDREGDIFETFQKDKFTKSISLIGKNNTWHDFFYVQSSSEYAQNRASSAMLWLSLFVAILSIISLDISIKQAKYNELATRSARIEQAKSIRQANENCKTAPSSSPSGLYWENGQEATCADTIKKFR
jgi:hypothetical protein